MDGFGLGSQEEISEKLQKIISSSAYQAAANKIDQNFQKKQNEDQTISSRPKWRRTLSTSRSKKYSLQDDFNSLPAMYDPFVSIYYLVKERKESDLRKAELLNSPLLAPLSRSTSTVITRPKQNDDLASSNSTKTDRTLTRRRTFDTSKKLPALPKQTEQPKLASQFPLPPPPPTPQEQKQPPTPTPSKSERLVSAGGLIRKKSMQAVRRLTSKLPNKQGAPEKAEKAEKTEKTEKKLSNRTSSSSNNTTSPVSSLSVGDNPSRKSLSKSHWLKLEVNNKSDVLKKVPSHHEKKLPEPTPSKSITRLSSKAGSTARRSWKRLSMNRKSTRLSFDNSTGNLPISDDPMGADIKGK
jgi:hypothetical protein